MSNDAQACCMPDGSCINATPNYCTDFLGGIPYDGMCADVECPQPESECRHARTDRYPIGGKTRSRDYNELAVMLPTRTEDAPDVPESVARGPWGFATTHETRAVNDRDADSCYRYWGELMYGPHNTVIPVLCSQPGIAPELPGPRGLPRWHQGGAIKQTGQLPLDVLMGSWVAVVPVTNPPTCEVLYCSDQMLCGGALV